MENIKTFFDAFKEFIWDIIGYLLPGSIVIILLSMCLNDQYYISSSLTEDDKGMFSIIFVIVSYLLGHALHGVGMIKERIRGNKSYIKKIEVKIAQRKNYTIAKDFVEKELVAKQSANNLSVAAVRDVRNIVMGFAPESDQKIYTFMFRSELSNKTGNTCLMVGIAGMLLFLFSIVFKIFHWDFDFLIFKIDGKYIILYIALIIAYFFFRETRNRFYEIAIGLPFSIYISKKLSAT